MTWTLAIDTSFHVAAGLARHGEPVGAVVVPDTRAHGEALMPAITRLCAEEGVALTDVEEFVVGMGPGPFTGLRVGVAAAWTLAALAGRPPRGVCSLDAVALQWTDAPTEFLVASDARRKELYWAHYRDGLRVGEPRVGDSTTLPALPVIGAVPEQYRSHLDHRPDGPTELDASVLAARWQTLAPAGDEPFYLRPADAVASSGPKPTLPRLRAR